MRHVQPGITSLSVMRGLEDGLADLALTAMYIRCSSVQHLPAYSYISLVRYGKYVRLCTMYAYSFSTQNCLIARSTFVPGSLPMKRNGLDLQAGENLTQSAGAILAL